MVWNKALPSGSNNINVGDDAIRANNNALETGLNTEHVLVTGGTQTLVHKFPNGDKTVMDALTTMATGSIAIRYTDADNPGIHAYDGAAWNQVATQIPATTAMVFHQAAAPAGWTADETLNDNMLMVVTEASGNGGSELASSTWTISAIITDQITGGHALTEAETAEHFHTIAVGDTLDPVTTTHLMTGSDDIPPSNGTTTTPLSGPGSGAGDPHTHTLPFVDTWRPLSRSVIVCTKKAVTA